MYNYVITWTCLDVKFLPATMRFLLRIFSYPGLRGQGTRARYQLLAETNESLSGFFFCRCSAIGHKLRHGHRLVLAALVIGDLLSRHFRTSWRKHTVTTEGANRGMVQIFASKLLARTLLLC
jgi:hypothetical protein